MEKSIKAEYSWHAKANAMLRRQKMHGYNDAELADLFGMTTSGVRELLAMRQCAFEYLRSRDKENHWSLVLDKEAAFRKIASAQVRLGTPGEQELFKIAAFLLIDNGAPVGMTLSDAISLLRECLQPIRERLLERFPIRSTVEGARDE